MRNFLLLIIAIMIGACAVMLGRIEITLREHRPIKMYNQEFTIPMYKGSKVELHEEACNE